MPDDARPSRAPLLYDRPLVSSVDGAVVRFDPLPVTSTLGKPGLPVRVEYENAPAGAALLVSVIPNVARAELASLPCPGGGLTAQPIPLEGDGVLEVQLAEEAFSAPTDVSRPYPLRNGAYVLLAQLFNHRRPVIGYVRRNPGDRILAEALSPPITLRQRD